MIGSRWSVLDNGTWSSLDCDFQPLCKFCQVPLECTSIALLNFPLNEPAYWENGEFNAHAVDVKTRCPECGWRKMFGVALPKEHWMLLHKQAEREYAGQMATS